MCFIRGPMLGLFCACLSATYGQGSPPTPVAADSDGSGLSVGVKLGVNLNQFRQPGTSIGLNAGGYASYGVLPFLTVRMEPQYSQEGGSRPD